MHEFLPTPLTRLSLRPPPLEGLPPSGSPGTPPRSEPPREELDTIEGLICDLGSADWTVSTGAQSRLASMGSRPVDALCEALRHRHWAIRWRAAWVLGRIGDVSAVPPLCAALKDKFGYMWQPARSIFEPEDRLENGAPIPAATKEQRALLRMEAAEALGRIGDPSAIPVLIGALWDRFETVQERAWLALVQIGDPTIQPLAGVVREAGTEARMLAVRVLGRLRNPDTIPLLIEALEDRHGKVRQEAADALLDLAREHRMLALRGAVAPLQRLASGWNREGAEAREKYQAALAAVETATAELYDLPLPAEAAAMAAHDLPRSAGAPAPVAGELPLPSVASAEPGLQPNIGGPWLMRCAAWLRSRFR